MNTKKHFELLTRCAIWAGTSEAFTALLVDVKRQTLFQSQGFSLLKPRTLGKLRNSRVTVIPVQGILTLDCEWCGTTYGSIADAAEEAAADPTVKRVVLAVDSPGGEVTGLPETAGVIAQVAKVKPVSAIVEGQAASAAYWLTSQANDITIAPSAELGSIGVRMMHVDVSKSLEDAGVKVTELHAGEFKTEWSPFQPLSEAAKEDMQQRLDSVHQDFLNAVGNGRGTRVKARIRANRFGEGRMFDAQTAYGHGLADKVQPPRDYYRSITPVEETSYAAKRARLQLERTRF